MEVLDVSYNTIEHCNFSGFHTLGKLKRMYLNDNKLIHLRPEISVTSETHFSLVDKTKRTWKNLPRIEEIRGNPWHCSGFDLVIKEMYYKHVRRTLCDKEFMKMENVCKMPKTKTCEISAFVEKTVYDNFMTSAANYKCDEVLSV